MTPHKESEEVRKKAARMAHARARPNTPWKELMHVGVLGWMFVLPLLLGLWAGRMIERQAQWTHSGLVGLLVGAAIGIYAVWRQVRRSITDTEDDA